MMFFPSRTCIPMSVAQRMSQSLRSSPRRTELRFMVLPLFGTLPGGILTTATSSVPSPCRSSSDFRPRKPSKKRTRLADRRWLVKASHVAWISLMVSDAHCMLELGRIPTVGINVRCQAVPMGEHKGPTAHAQRPPDLSSLPGSHRHRRSNVSSSFPRNAHSRKSSRRRGDDGTIASDPLCGGSDVADPGDGGSCGASLSGRWSWPMRPRGRPPAMERAAHRPRIPACSA
mmetsp:Transcript_4811/g.13389  ORF Transcript_4811/g.13389 Transcript_4811/m.13389 type:complete len:230 (-) Transcript_4811:1317-2006(-)